MTGIFKTKYNVAVLDGNLETAKHVSDVIKEMYGHKVEITKYDDSDKFFLELNVAKAKNRPFDLVIVCSDNMKITKHILCNTDSSIDVINYKNDTLLRQAASERFKYDLIPQFILSLSQ